MGREKEISHLPVCKTSEDMLVLGGLQTFAFDGLFKNLLCSVDFCMYVGSV